MIVLGAGLAGLITGAINKDATLYELGPLKKNHNALLRFRTDAIGKAIGIPFKKVRVYKGIWHANKSCSLSPEFISAYSRKVSGAISYRSITNLEPVDRYIAPPDFYQILVDICDKRIVENAQLEYMLWDYNIISTLPIFVNSKFFLDKELTMPERASQSIYVSKYKINNCDVYMTNYYPRIESGLYRASITGDTLIIESMTPITTGDLWTVKGSFDLFGCDMTDIVINFEQPNGKMVAMDERLRREVILRLTTEHRVFSLGRFATWRNILLDDIHNDISVINRLMNADNYAAHMESKL